MNDDILYCARLTLVRGKEVRAMIMRDADELALFNRIESLSDRGVVVFVDEEYTVIPSARPKRKRTKIPLAEVRPAHYVAPRKKRNRKNMQ